MSIAVQDKLSTDMFFLSREEHFEIKYSDDWEAVFLSYADQIDIQGEHLTSGVDKFGRNQVDRLFIYLMFILYTYLESHNDVDFKRLVCTRIGEKYVVKLELGIGSVEMGLSKMIESIERLF